MGLISQNSEKPNGVDKKKSKRKVLDEGEKVVEQESDVGNLGIKKNKKEKVENEEVIMKEEMERKKIENLLFGSLHFPVEFGKEEDVEEGGIGGEVDDPALFFMDRSADSRLSVYEDDEEFPGESKVEDVMEERKCVWVDDEEEKLSVNVGKVNRLRKLRKEEGESVITGAAYVSRLRAQHEKLNRGTDWARLDSREKEYDSGEDSDEESGVAVAKGYKDDEDVNDILRSNQDLVVKSGGKLMPGLLEYSKLVDANAEEPAAGPITSVQFHRNAQLLLTAGLDKRLRFFQIDGKRNTKIQSIFLEDCAIHKASFSPDGSQVFISGRRKFFYSFDLVKATVDKIGPLTGREEKSLEYFEVSPDSKTIAFIGNEGYILLVSAKTKELIGTLKMNGTCRSLAFAEGGQQLLSSGGDGHIYHWDLRTRTCFHKGVDEGCINSSFLCTSPSGNLFAAGSDSGIVNVYNREDFLGGKRKPLKTIENLTTRVGFMKFNHDAQILAISSSYASKSLKLVHIPSFTVFSNWPPPNKSLPNPYCLDFSPNGGFMAFGNSAGKVLLYKLHHYNRA
ncbi:hypothetical protein DCAR_0102811 [Daucus carota subsp. sativus]|uniref:U3 small nucleolar RNA-associated protein 18 homolog n=1 Tax=Daucus carota subsp. sativus TaxID=79200 RepID=A0A166HB17_DAUCS|nr:PREDICTED: U3 small nucleolar RNA-associated protein 18 homolog [Daucus carota subsp. sativus]WOG83634.1 hypothetical protein DCAR_0102811 [Daucus carota subsp. sativus]